MSQNVLAWPAPQQLCSQEPVLKEHHLCQGKITFKWLAPLSGFQFSGKIFEAVDPLGIKRCCPNYSWGPQCTLPSQPWHTNASHLCSRSWWAWSPQRWVAPLPLYPWIVVDSCSLLLVTHPMCLSEDTSSNLAPFITVNISGRSLLTNKVVYNLVFSFLQVQMVTSEGTGLLLWVSAAKLKHDYGSIPRDPPNSNFLRCHQVLILFAMEWQVDGFTAEDSLPWFVPLSNAQLGIILNSPNGGYELFTKEVPLYIRYIDFWSEKDNIMQLMGKIISQSPSPSNVRNFEV